MSESGQGGAFDPPRRINSSPSRRPWAANQSHDLSNLEDSELKELKEKAPVLDRSKFSSVSRAVDYLNSLEDKQLWEELAVRDYCIVFSASSSRDFLLYKVGGQRKAYDLCKIALSWNVKNSAECKMTESLSRYLVDFFKSLEHAVEVLNYPYDAEKVVAVHDFCVLQDDSDKKHYVLWEEGKKEQVDQKFDVVEPEAISPMPPLQREVSSGTTLFNGFFRKLFPLDTSTSEERPKFENSKLVNTFAKPLKERYDYQRQLGAGAQGTAHLVKKKKCADETDDLFVAKECNDHSKEGVKAFMTEFERMRQLRHPNCLKVLELIDYENKVYIITEFARGGDLFNYMTKMMQNREPVSEHVIANMFQQALQGLAFLHAEGIIHNDIKPENLLVMDPYQKYEDGQSPRLVVADYGCATLMNDSNKIFFGDPRYLAPEAMKSMMDHLNRKKIGTEFMTSKIDIWAMGATIYEVLGNGVLPFIYDKCSLADLSGMFPVLLDGLNSDAKVEFHDWEYKKDSEAILEAMLAKKVEDRKTAAEVLTMDWFKTATTVVAKNALSHVKFSDTQSRVKQILRNAVAAKLRYEHVEHCYKVFQKFDPDNSGTISCDEFRLAWNEFNTCDEQKCDDYFSRADVDGTGTLEFNEFAAITLDWTNLDSAALNQQLFDLFDHMDGSTEMNKDRFAQLFEERFEKIPDLAATLSEIDSDHDGRISMNELKAFVQGSNRRDHSESCVWDILSADTTPKTRKSLTNQLSKGGGILDCSCLDDSDDDRKIG